MCRILEYQFPLRYYQVLSIAENLRTTASVDLINFQDSMRKMYFNTYYARTVSNIWIQYLDILRMLVLLR